MKPIELFFGALLVPVDFFAILLAGITAYSIRFSAQFAELRPVFERVPFADYVWLVGVVGAAWVVLFALLGLYRLRGTRRIVDEVTRVFFACSTGMLGVILVIFFQRELFVSRFLVLALWALAMLYVIGGRLIVLLLQRFLLSRGVGTHRLFLVGDDASAEQLVGLFQNHRWLGYAIVGRAHVWDDAARQQLSKLAANNEIDEVIQVDPKISRSVSLELIDACEEHHLTFKYLADLYATHTVNMSVATIGGIQLIELKQTRLDGWGRIWKRAFDIVVSFLLLILLSPVMAFAALAIFIESGLPIFFRKLDNGSPAMRVGQAGRLFRHLKFRSMRVGTHALRYTALAERNMRGGPLVKIKDDPRITRVGRFIRRWSLDELPELFLVLKGDMSLVGPRPHLPEEVLQYSHQHKKLLAIKPGITGMAQISGRSDLSFDEEARLDTYYIERWSPWLDLYILLKTPLAVVQHRKAE
ncbi:sugar transferase [Candidatus Uhrbacteria bacterium]|nr:sugar transferase [Candidatus Uhrbacteria bacterium]